MFRRIGAAMLMAAMPVVAQMPAGMAAGDEAAPCPLPLVAPAPWAGWGRPGPLVATERPGGGPAETLAPGHAVSVTLAPSDGLVFAVAPARAAGPTSYGGMLSLAVPRAGTYRVAIGAAAWIDTVQEGRAVASVAHRHGPACSGIVKMVDFVLAAGTATIELSGAPSPVTTAMVVRVA